MNGVFTEDELLQLDDVMFDEPMVMESPAMDKLREAALRAVNLEHSIKVVEADLKTLNENYRNVITSEIPSLMAELGELSEVKGEWGTVKLTPFWSGKITPEKEKTAFAWLDEHGHGGIVKRDIHVNIMKGDDRHAEEVRKRLELMGASFEEKQGVHHQTLQGFIRAMAKAGTPVPTDLFNVYSGTVAKVTVTKE